MLDMTMTRAVGVAALGILGCRALLRIRNCRPRLQRSARRKQTTACTVHPPPASATGAPAGGLTLLPDEYPKTRRGDIVDKIHGRKIADPYRWLEDPESEETKAFVDAQNKVTQSVLAQCHSQDKFKALMQQLYDYPRYSTPSRHGERYYYSHNTGLQAQSVVYSQRSLDGEAVVLIDPNNLSDDGTVALMGSAFSEDGKTYAYSLSSGGSDWRTVKFMSVDQVSGDTTDLPDVLEQVKFSSMAWTHDHRGLFYNKYPKPETRGSGEAGTETDINLRQQLVYHVLGTPQAEDVVVMAAPEDNPEWMLGAQVTDDGRYLIISVGSGCEPVNRLWYVDLEALPRGEHGSLALETYDCFKKGHSKFPVVKLVDDFEAQWEVIANEEQSFTLMTNLNAPRYRIVRADLTDPGVPSDWQDVVPQHRKDLLQWGSALKGDTLAVCYLRDVQSALELRSLSSGDLRAVLPLPGIGSVTSFSGRRKDSEYFFTFTGFTEPGAIYRADAQSPEKKPSLYRRIELQCDFKADDFETSQQFYLSKDGTRIPMFIVHKKGIKLDGNNPTLLYGYGGFNISLEPSFSVSRLTWILGYNGVYAVANIRGGGEYGIDWRDAGSKARKQNCFDDFVAAAEHLHSQGYSSPKKTAIQGGSNGGLLVAACANQRPDLFAAVLAQVGVMDLLRFHKFTIGHAWTTDFGNPDVKEDFKYILPISPIHNVHQPSGKDGASRQYPAMLITTGDHDDRVVPLHSHKLTATLQHALCGPDSPQTNPLVTRIEVRAGHGAGKPTAKVIAENAAMFSFAAAAMKAPWVGLQQ